LHHCSLVGNRLGSSNIADELLYWYAGSVLFELPSHVLRLPYGRSWLQRRGNESCCGPQWRGSPGGIRSDSKEREKSGVNCGTADEFGVKLLDCFKTSALGIDVVVFHMLGGRQAGGLRSDPHRFTSALRSFDCVLYTVWLHPVLSASVALPCSLRLALARIALSCYLP